MGPYGGGPGVAGIPGHVGNFGGNFGRGGFVPRGGRGGPGVMGFGPGQFGGRGGFNPAMAGGRGGLGKNKVHVQLFSFKKSTTATLNNDESHTC